MTRPVLVLLIAHCVTACGPELPSNRPRDASAASASPDRPSMTVGIDPDSTLDATCDFVKVQTHSDAHSLVTDFVARAAKGDFAGTNEWLGSALDCYGHEPGYDSFDVAQSYATQSINTSGDTVRYLLTINVAGFAAGGEFERNDTTVHDTLVVYRTKYGWRIKSPAPWNWIDYEHAKSKGWI